MSASRLLQPRQLDAAAAEAELRRSLALLLQRVAACRPVDGSPSQRRYWQVDAGTWCYHTAIAAPCHRPHAAQAMAGIFYRAATLPRQPWYAQFRGGAALPMPQPLPDGVAGRQLCWSRFDLGLRRCRAYRQQVTWLAVDETTAAVVLRSVASDWRADTDSVLAYTLAPTGDVFRQQDGCLQWHHVCTTDGVGLLPMPLDRWLINALRAVGLDGAERHTYRDEALAWAKWVGNGFGLDGMTD